MLDPWFKRQYPLKHLKKCLYWPWGEYRVLRDARAVLFTCEEERRLARLSFDRYRVNECVIGYGITEPPADAARMRAAFFERFPQLRDKRLLLFLGRLHPKKGCDLLIEAFAGVAARDPTLHLVMAGPDQDDTQAALMKRVEVLGIGARISWTGMLLDDLKWGAYHAAEAFVLSSHQENFGIAVAEALACSVPVLISNQVNIWREIAADQAGLVAEDTMHGTRELLESWLALSQSERERMKHNARACFRRHFLIHSVADRLADVLQAAPCGPQHTCAA
jgi:glycosyltransferase involved in cell wall biosynthesis